MFIAPPVVLCTLECCNNSPPKANPKCERHFCPVGGLDAKVEKASKFHKGRDAYDQCVGSVVSCLGNMRTSYSEKGNDTNTEAEGELSETTAISVKQPYRTVLTFLSPLISAWFIISGFMYGNPSLTCIILKAVPYYKEHSPKGARHDYR